MKMKNLLLGIDICQISRIENAYKKFGSKFLKKTFTQDEIDYCLSSKKRLYDRLSVRFAMKEAVSKALGVGINSLGWDKGINWKDVEIFKQNSHGAISVKLHGKAKKLAHLKNISHWQTSVSHMGDYAIAEAIAIINNTPSTSG